MVLSCEDVSLGYEGKPVVEHLNFRLEQGDYLCILGENGSGKSTLMKAILGLKSPMQGMFVRGEDLKANEIGYLPQQTVTQRDFPASRAGNRFVRASCRNVACVHSITKRSGKSHRRT